MKSLASCIPLTKFLKVYMPNPVQVPRDIVKTGDKSSLLF